RWSKSFLPYTESTGKGGVPAEGTQYGPYMVGYMIMPLETAALMGRNLLTETNWYKEFVYSLIYLTSPGPTTRPQDEAAYYQIAPWSDCCDRGSDNYYPSAAHYDWDGIMRTLANQYSSLAVGKHARQWINMVRNGNDFYHYVHAADPGSPAEPLTTLPTDY